MSDRRLHAWALAAAGLIFFSGSAARADTVPYDPFVTRTTYGDIGLLEMPGAHMAPDGEIAVTAGAVHISQRYALSFQILPWLEGEFRYSRVGRVIGFSGHAEYDRSFGLKVRLWQEDETWPDVSLGIRDILGTGIYGSEYLVASKHAGDFDFDLGVGWGRLASSNALPNPLGELITSFKTRPPFSGSGGVISFGQFFHGPKIGIFGGAIWRTPIEGLQLVAEYSSDRYVAERGGGGLLVRSPFNIGLTYHVSEGATISAAYLYGTTFGLILSANANPTVALSATRLGPQIPPPYIRAPKQQVDALASLLARARPVAGKPGTPFVQLPLPQHDPDSLTLAAALMSETAGVHDVDVMGRTVVVDAHLTRLADRQCDTYASIVASLAPKLDTIALSDSSDSSGHVSFCSVPRRAAFAEAPDAPAGGAAPAGPVYADITPEEASRKIRDAVAAQALGVEALGIEREMLWIYFTNPKYASEAEAAGRIARILMANAPSSVEIFHIVSVRNGVELREFQVARSALERATLAYGTPRELEDAVSIKAPPLSNPILERAFEETYPRFHWDISPGLRQGLFDPNAPLQIAVLVSVGASVDVTHNLTFEGRADANIFNNYNFNSPSDSLLPHVRSDGVEYLHNGLNGISYIDANYRARLSRDVYFEAKVGYLEDMFAGGGVQVLWRPEGQRFAFGIDVYQVWQRDFDRLFGVRDYQILTGHASMYYESPWYDLDFAVHVGRYLAGDYGVTFEATRRFDSGVEIGAFATFTNVPFARFGEGSFDKGLIIHIPFEWALPFYSRSSYDLLLRSLTRDGGARLYDDDSLYGETRPSSYGEVLRHINDITAP